jgi:siroheme synthase-like protein
VSSITSRSATDPAFYPLFLNVAGRLCLVIGGGAVAQRKVRMLLSFGASVRLSAPKVTAYLQKLSDAGRIELRLRPYDDGDLAGATLVFAATDDGAVNRSAAAEAQRLGIPINVADDPALCDFYVPSIVRKGPITIAISTSGALPSLSKRLRLDMEKWITRDYERYLKKVSRLRAWLIETEGDRRKRMAVMRRLARLPMTEVLDMTTRELKTMLTAGQ